MKFIMEICSEITKHYLCLSRALVALCRVVKQSEVAEESLSINHNLLLYVHYLIVT